MGVFDEGRKARKAGSSLESEWIDGYKRFFGCCTVAAVQTRRPLLKHAER